MNRSGLHILNNVINIRGNNSSSNYIRAILTLVYEHPHNNYFITPRSHGVNPNVYPSRVLRRDNTQHIQREINPPQK
jgi:hypothetical protein